MCKYQACSENNRTFWVLVAAFFMLLSPGWGPFSVDWRPLLNRVNHSEHCACQPTSLRRFVIVKTCIRLFIFILALRVPRSTNMPTPTVSFIRMVRCCGCHRPNSQCCAVWTWSIGPSTPKSATWSSDPGRTAATKSIWNRTIMQLQLR